MTMIVFFVNDNFEELEISLKALFFLNSFAGGGAEKVCMNLAHQLYEQGIESDFVTIFNNEPDYDIPEYIHVFSLAIEDKPLECLRIIKKIPKVNKYISGKKYVLITAHVQPSQFLAALTIVGKKCLYVMHKSRHRNSEHSTLFERICLRFFLNGKKVITVSEGVRKELIGEYGIKSVDILTIYNPCVVKKIEPKTKLISNRRPYILFIGRLEDQKNPLLALELYYKGSFYDKYDLVYLGKGSLAEKLKMQIRNYDLSHRVFLMGFQKNPELWLSNASLLLSCSRQEGFSMNLAEALFCETPVVAADCPYGPNEILTGELSTFLIDPEREFEKSISVISSALETYPEITEKFYAKFDVALVTQRYLNTWQLCFGLDDSE